MFHICVNGQGKKNLISGPISPFFYMMTSSLTKCVFVCSETVMNMDDAALVVMVMLQVVLVM